MFLNFACVSFVGVFVCVLFENVCVFVYGIAIYLNMYGEGRSGHRACNCVASVRCLCSDSVLECFCVCVV